jgi:ABC-2 type transport system permease protein
MPVVHEPNAWTALSTGLRDVHPYSRHLRFTGLVPQLYQADIANPLKQLAGSFDYGFVLIFLVPLFVIGVSYDVRSRDEDLGTEPLVCSQPVRLSRLLALRLALRAALVASVARALFAFAAAWLGLPLDARAGAFALASLAYIALWFLLVFLVVSLRRSSAWNAITLAGAWIGWCVLLPALVNVALVTGAPARGGVELTLAQREQMNAGWDRPKRATLDPFFARRPEWAGTAVPEDRFSWPWYYAMHEVGDAHVAGEIEAYHAALARRERWTARAALALPPLALELVLDRMAGTDMASELAFRDSIAAYHEQMKRYFYPLVFNHEGLSAFDLDAVPRHRFQGVEPPVHLSGLAGLFGVLALLGALLPLAARRIDAMPEPEEGGALVPAHGRRPDLVRLGRGARAPRRAARPRGGAEGVI